MLGKLCRKIHKKLDALLSCIFKARYFPSTDFVDAPIGSALSYTWRGIHMEKDLVRRGTRWK